MDIVLDRIVERTETNIDRDKVNIRKRAIVAYKSRVNNIFNDMEASVSTITNNFGGIGSKAFERVFNKISSSNSNVLYNIDLHIDELNRACTLYQNQDSDVGQSVDTNISNGTIY